MTYECNYKTVSYIFTNIIDSQTFILKYKRNWRLEIEIELHRTRNGFVA